MGKDILIYGGYNWLGYELMTNIIKYNLFTNIIIVDNLHNFLLKDNIKSKFDNYYHLYNVNIHLHNCNIKDKEELIKIYKKYNISCVLNNIKYNIYDSEQEKKDKLMGYKNIGSIHKNINIQNGYEMLYLCIIRMITHNKIYLNNLSGNHVENNILFNEIICKELNITENINTVEILIPDYIYGTKCNNFFKKLVNMFNCKAPLIIPDKKEYFFCLCDEDFISYILLIIENSKNKDLYELDVIGTFSYSHIINFIKKYKNSSLMRLIEYNNPDTSSVKIDNKLYKYILSLL
uniref:NAD-dependent epimerase/dehydratase domain-containing protein n=1 Tax=Florenciella sp. virus SA2 TaxID=3240092 RepID=A0AB39J7F3_9VIRU